MRLRVIVDRLKLTKENLEFGYGNEFEVSEERGTDILKTTYNGNPVVEFVSSNDAVTDDELLNANKELEAKVNELTVDNDSLKVENEKLEAKVNELTSAYENLIVEKEELEKLITNLPDNSEIESSEIEGSKNINKKEGKDK